MKLIINGAEIEATRGETVLKAARRAGVDIPHLCSLDWAPSPAASCRLCVVEVEGNPRLLTSCTLDVTEGMQVRTHTPRVLKARRAIMELLIASHPQDCLSCVRGGDCELAMLAGDLGVRKARYVGAVKQHPVDISSPALWRDPNKCVLCGRCVTVCHDVQGVGAIDFVGRGFKTKVAPGFSTGLNVSDCVYCGQCARVCPTGAIVERDQVDEVVTALADPDTVVVAQVAPAVPATLLEGHSKTEGVRVMLERLAAALKRVGFDAVFDTGFAADLTIMEEGSELLDRVQNGGVLPMFTSCSPAWVNYVETHRPDLIPHLSTCKSPQQMAGALIREIYPRHAGVEGKRLVVVSVMPCTAKKFEAQDQTGVDFVLTTRELRAPVGPVRPGLRAVPRASAARRAVRGGHRRRPPVRRQRRRDGGRPAHRRSARHRRGARGRPQGDRGARQRGRASLHRHGRRRAAEPRRRQRPRPAGRVHRPAA